MKRFLRTLVLLAVALSPMTQVPTTCSAGVSDVVINVWGELPRFHDNGNAIVVGGFLHSIAVSLDAPAVNITIIFHQGSSPPSVANETNFYVWTCFGAAWSDVRYGQYLNASQCSRIGNEHTFAVGISARAEVGAWTMTTHSDGVAVWSEAIEVEAPQTGFSLSRPDFSLTVQPFAASTVSTYSFNNQSYNIRSSNAGNVPLALDFSFEPLSQYLSATNDTGVFHVGEMRYHYITLSAPAWSPRVVEVVGTVTGRPQYLITPSSEAFVTAFTQDFCITVGVHRTGYTLLDMGSLVVQYQKSFPLLDYRQSATLRAYLTGEGDASLLLSDDGVSITGAMLDGDVANPSNISISLSNSTEAELTVLVMAATASDAAFMARLRYEVYWTVGNYVGGARWAEFNTSIMVNRAQGDVLPEGDIDDDGLPDSWEMEHFYTLAYEGEDDYDGDGATNREEMVAGTDPSNPEDHLDADGGGSSNLWLLLVVAIAAAAVIGAALALKARRKPPTIGDGDRDFGYQYHPPPPPSP